MPLLNPHFVRVALQTFKFALRISETSTSPCKGDSGYRGIDGYRVEDDKLRSSKTSSFFFFLLSLSVADPVRGASTTFISDCIAPQPPQSSSHALQLSSAPSLSPSFTSLSRNPLQPLLPAITTVPAPKLTAILTPALSIPAHANPNDTRSYSNKRLMRHQVLPTSRSPSCNSDSSANRRNTNRIQFQSLR